MRFLLVSVTDGSAASRANLGALLQSVADQDRDVDFVLVMRGGGAPPADPSARVRLRAVTQPLATGVSVARNAALRAAREEGILAAADVVGFPDDDCRLVHRDDLVVVVHLQGSPVEHEHSVLTIDVVGRQLIALLGLRRADDHRLAARPPGCTAVGVLLVGTNLVQLAVLRRAWNTRRRAPCSGQLRSRVVLVVWHDFYDRAVASVPGRWE